MFLFSERVFYRIKIVCLQRWIYILNNGLIETKWASKFFFMTIGKFFIVKLKWSDHGEFDLRQESET